MDNAKAISEIVKALEDLQDRARAKGVGINLAALIAQIIALIKGFLP